MAVVGRILLNFGRIPRLLRKQICTHQRLRQFTTVNLIHPKVARYGRRLGFGSVVTSMLIASRGLSLWTAAPKPEEVATPSPDELAIEDADRLYHSYEIMSLYNHLLKYKDSKNEDLIWRLARAARDVSNLDSTSPSDKQRLVYEAMEYAKRALELNDSNYACHKWYAICLSNVGDYEGVKQTISNAFVIREHFEKAIQLNPKDATSIHLIGIWCFTFADMPWYQIKIASVVFATPPSSSYEDALKYFLEAEAIDPNFYSKNLLMIGKTYVRMGYQKPALLYLTRARDAPARKEEEYQTRNEAIELLSGLGVKS